MPADDKSSLVNKGQIDSDLLDAQAIVKEFDRAFTPLDRACDMLESSLESLTQSPSSLVH